MSGEDKLQALRAVEGSGLPAKTALKQYLLGGSRMKSFVYFSTVVAVSILALAGCSPDVSLVERSSGEEKTEQTVREQVEEIQGIGGAIQAPVVDLQLSGIREELSIQGQLVPERSAIVKPLMDVGKVSFARSEETAELTGMMIGGVTALALPAELPIYLDPGLMNLDYIILGGGSRSLKIKISPKIFDFVPNARVVEGLTGG